MGEEARGVGVVDGPAVAEVLAQVVRHELRVPLGRLLERLEHDRDEEPQEDHTQEDGVGEKEEFREKGVTTAYWMDYKRLGKEIITRVVHEILICGLCYAIKGRTVSSGNSFHKFRPALTC